MRGLLSYFEPFDGYSDNSSERVVTHILKEDLKDLDLNSISLPVEFERAWAPLKSAIQSQQPDFVIAFGQAGGLDQVHLERVAINMMDARIPDNSGFQPNEEAISPEGLPAYFSTLPFKAIAKHLKGENSPVTISNTAGTFVCNTLMYRLLEFTHAQGIPAGFIHVPLLPDQEREGKMPQKFCSLERTASVVAGVLTYIQQWKAKEKSIEPVTT